MWQVDVPLGEFYDEIVEAARRARYLAILTALVREADSSSFYDDISRYWDSLSDVTGPDILFVLAGTDASSKVRYHGEPDYERSIAYTSQSAAVAHTAKRRLRLDLSHWAANVGTPIAPQVKDLARSQTRAISALRQRLGVPESQVPCLHLEFIGHRSRQGSVNIPLSGTIYELVKRVMARFDNQFAKIKAATQTAELEASWEAVFNAASELATAAGSAGQANRIFIAYQSEDRWIAEYLHSALSQHAATFLDVRCVLPGDRWVERIRNALDDAEITVALVGKSKATSWFQQAEYLRAIELARANKQRLIPVYLGGSLEAAPYGLEGVQGIVTTWASGLRDIEVREIAARIAALLSSR